MIDRKHVQEPRAMSPRARRAALRVLVSAFCFPLMTSCTAAEPQVPGPALVPSAAEIGPSRAQEVGAHPKDIHVDIEPVPGVSNSDFAAAKAEFERMRQVMETTKPGGCDPPPLLPMGDCEQVGACDSFPFLAYVESTTVVIMASRQGEVPPGAQITIELIQCGPTPVTIATHSLDVSTGDPDPLFCFPAHMDPKGKYHLRISSKIPALPVTASYQVLPESPAKL